MNGLGPQPNLVGRMHWGVRDLIVHTVDMHVGGQPIRAVGVATVEEADACLPQEYVERLCAPPRGRPSDVIAVHASHSDGLYARFQDVAGPIDMCGEGLIALAILAWQAGLVADHSFGIYTAHGRVNARVAATDGTASVTLPPARIASRVVVPLPDGVDVEVTIVDGAGNLFAVADAAVCGLDLARETEVRLRAVGLTLRDELTRQLGHVAPTMVQFAEFGSLPLSRNVVIWGPDGNIDRGPCGTGSAARAAVLHAAGDLPVGTQFTSAGLSDQTMAVRLLECRNSERCDEVVVELTAAAHPLAESDHYFSVDDVLLGLPVTAQTAGGTG